MSIPRTALSLRAPAVSRRGILGLAAAAVCAAQAAPARAAATVERSRKVGAGLYEVVVNPNDNLVYVAAVGPRGANAAAILALDPETLETRRTIAVADQPAFGLALNPCTDTLYTTNTRSGSVSAIDARNGTVRARIAEGENAHVRQVVVDAENGRAFVSVFGFRETPSAVWVIDTNANRLVRVITEGLEGGITGLAHDRANNRLFVTALTSHEVVEIGLANNKAVRRFGAGGEGPVNLVLDAGRGRLLVTNQRSGELVAINVADGAVAGKAATGEGALGVSINPTNGLAYVANRRAGTVSIVDPGSLEVRASLPTGTHPNTVAFDARGTAYVTNKARAAPRGEAPVEDPNGDTVSIIRP